VRHDVIHGHPARILATYSTRADLVVIGRHGGRGVGSIQHALLDHAHGPVAVVPSGS
jgi:nucleotide-binding universal stress UspA family protein